MSLAKPRRHYDFVEASMCIFAEIEVVHRNSTKLTVNLNMQYTVVVVSGLPAQLAISFMVWNNLYTKFNGD